MRLQLTTWPPWLGAAGMSLGALFAAACSEPGAGGAPPARTPEVPRPNLVSVTVEQDMSVVSGDDVCGQNAQLHRGFACFRADQTQYHGTPSSQAGGDPSGVFLATTRVLLSFDRVLWDNWTIGGRLGAVVRGGGPKPDGATAPSFLPVHGELRAGYWFGVAPFVDTGFRAGLFLAGGVAQVDAMWQVYVVEDPEAKPPASQPVNPPSQALDAYQKSGTAFLGGGLSVAYAFLPMSAVILHLKGMGLFPSSGAALATELGYEHAF